MNDVKMDESKQRTAQKTACGPESGHETRRARSREKTTPRPPVRRLTDGKAKKPTIHTGMPSATICVKSPPSNANCR